MTNRELADRCTAFWNPPRYLCEDCNYRDNFCRTFRRKYGGESPYMLNAMRPELYTDEEIQNQEENK